MLRAEVSSTILAIETSSSRGSVALFKQAELVAERYIVSEKNRNSELFPALEGVLELVPSAGLDVILIGSGPGSFNGTRVAIAVAQAIALLHECPVVSVLSFHGLASVRSGETTLVCGDARRKRFYRQVAEKGRLVGSVGLLTEEELEAEAAAFDGLILTNDEAARMPFLTGVKEETSEASALVAAWQTFSEEEKEALARTPAEPAYLRPPLISQAKPRAKLGARGI